MGTQRSQLRSLAQWLYARLAAVFADAPPGLALTGVLGLAAVLYGVYQFRLGSQSPGPARPRGSQAAARGSGVRPQAPAQQSAAPAKPAQAATHAPSSSSLAPSRLRSQLAGVRKVTISAPGVLLEEWLPHELQEGASLRPEAAQVVADMARCSAVYVLAHVSDDIGEATVRGALEAGGLVGAQQGQVPPHRLLFCSTLEGKESIVRQLEPELHIDGHQLTVKKLQPFMAQLLLITRPAELHSFPVFKNVGCAPTLPAAFSLD